MAGIAETAKLMSELNLKDNFTPAANKAMKSLGRLESTGFRIGQNIGKGINNAAKNIKKIATVGVVALAGAARHPAECQCAVPLGRPVENYYVGSPALNAMSLVLAILAEAF